MSWGCGRPGIRLDQHAAVHGATDADGKARHLVAAVRHDTVTVAGQRAAGATTNETTAFTPLLEAVDITGPATTATVRGHLKIENLHQIRDVTHREDASRVLTGTQRESQLGGRADSGTVTQEETHPGGVAILGRHEGRPPPQSLGSFWNRVVMADAVRRCGDTAAR